jgi:hypothetical protein
MREATPAYEGRTDEGATWISQGLDVGMPPGRPFPAWPLMSQHLTYFHLTGMSATLIPGFRQKQKINAMELRIEQWPIHQLTPATAHRPVV